MATVRYSVWVKIDRDGGEDLSDGQLEAVHQALSEIPGFIESSFEDSWEGDE